MPPLCVFYYRHSEVADVEAVECTRIFLLLFDGKWAIDPNNSNELSKKLQTTLLVLLLLKQDNVKAK